MRLIATQEEKLRYVIITIVESFIKTAEKKINFTPGTSNKRQRGKTQITLYSVRRKCKDYRILKMWWSNVAVPALVKCIGPHVLVPWRA